MKNLFYWPLVFCLAFCFSACSSANRKDNEVRMKLSADSSAVELHNLPAAVLRKFQGSIPDNVQWKNLFAVYAEPADESLRDFQPALEGKYVLVRQAVIFVPAVKFQKSQAYFARCYAGGIVTDPLELVLSQKLPSARKPLEFRFKF